MPEQPRGWLIQTATRRLIDAWRGEKSRRDRESRLALQQSATSTTVPGADDSLVVLFLCCHPSLPPASAIALTLRAVGGLTTAEIAHAFLVPETTMAQRISRAKQRIKASDEPFRMPTSDEQASRLSSALHVLYLIFNEGYASSGGGELTRTDLSQEAIRLTRMVRRTMPTDGEVGGLLALMLLIDARRPARTDAAGRLVLLADQDRTLWDHDLIEEGVTLLNESLAGRAVGEYQLQAAIASVHDRAAHAGDTDWPHILALYGLLEKLTDNPVVTLNKAVAAAMAIGPVAGLKILEDVETRLPEHHRVSAVRAHLLDMAGDLESAQAQYREAADRATNLAERHYLTARAAALAGASDMTRHQPIS